jgi:hypothetical protein
LKRQQRSIAVFDLITFENVIRGKFGKNYGILK